MPAVPELSVIIPVLNEATAIGPCLDAVERQPGPSREVLVVDGGSRDDTVRRARAAGVRVLRSAPGRGVQLSAGTVRARGRGFVFLHVDTRLPARGLEAIAGALAGGAAGGKFPIRYVHRHAVLRALQVCSHRPWSWCSFGDAALFADRNAYARAGGFEPVPLFEDVRFYGRLRATGPVRVLPEPVITSCRRFCRGGVWRQLGRNGLLFTAHALGAEPAALARFYDGPQTGDTGARWAAPEGLGAGCRV